MYHNQSIIDIRVLRREESLQNIFVFEISCNESMFWVAAKNAFEAFLHLMLNIQPSTKIIGDVHVTTLTKRQTDLLTIKDKSGSSRSFTEELNTYSQFPVLIASDKLNG